MELGAQYRSDPGHAEDHFGVLVLAKPRLDELVDFRELLAERDSFTGQSANQLRGKPFSGEHGVLAFGGGCGSCCELGGIAPLAVA
jgi:hypothetical protein